MLKERSSRFVYVIVAIAAMSLGIISGYIGSAMLEGQNSAVDKQIDNNNLTAESIVNMLILDAQAATTQILQSREYPVSVTLEVPIDAEKVSKPTTIEKYVIREYSDQIAVYEIDINGDSTITNLLGVDISTLPEHDKEILKEGIVVYSEEEMLQILEDYMS